MAPDAFQSVIRDEQNIIVTYSAFRIIIVLGIYISPVLYFGVTPLSLLVPLLNARNIKHGCLC